MKFSSLFAASSAVAVVSITLCGLSGTAMSQTDATISLPGVVVAAPRHISAPQRPKHFTVARTIVSPQTSSTTPTSPMVRLAKLASETGSCVGGCVTSFKSGDAPWHGCSGSSGTYSPTCRNTGNFKTYNECAEAGLVMGWRTSDVSWYCTSLALK